jgi:hypothetical protein
MNIKMLKMAFAGVVLGVSGFANAGLIFLDADTVSTGSALESSPLITSLGAVNFLGEIRGTTDDDLIAAGSVGNVFDIDGTSNALFTFDFDVTSITFIFGGNSGVFNMIAKDMLGNTVDSFFTNDTGTGASAGPITLTGVGIRSLFWEDPGNSFAAIDNVWITDESEVPEPSTLVIFALGIMGLFSCRFKK